MIYFIEVIFSIQSNNLKRFNLTRVISIQDIGLSRGLINIRDKLNCNELLLSKVFLDAQYTIYCIPAQLEQIMIKHMVNIMRNIFWVI